MFTRSRQYHERADRFLGDGSMEDTNRARSTAFKYYFEGERHRGLALFHWAMSIFSPS